MRPFHVLYNCILGACLYIFVFIHAQVYDICIVPLGKKHVCDSSMCFIFAFRDLERTPSKGHRFSSAYVCKHVYMYKYACMRACVYVCIYVCAHICVCVCMYLDT